MRERTQVVRVEVSKDGGQTYCQVLVQEYPLSPRGATYQREELRLDLHQVRHLRLTIVPKERSGLRHSLRSAVRLGVRTGHLSLDRVPSLTRARPLVRNTQTLSCVD